MNRGHHVNGDEREEEAGRKDPPAPCPPLPVQRILFFAPLCQHRVVPRTPPAPLPERLPRSRRASSEAAQVHRRSNRKGAPKPQCLEDAWGWAGARAVADVAPCPGKTGSDTPRGCWRRPRARLEGPSRARRRLLFRGSSRRQLLRWPPSTVLGSRSAEDPTPKSCL